ncbi:uncharacterized protein LOC135383143 isoform X1 [Ornithodoros turicata]|uniref:uncharacterized protein LOC135383143 isoform X1 n=1 Tax=Ornithodoros turicata TaxID=34597 RepID=UPI003139D973
MAKMWEFDAFIDEGDEDFASYVERFGHYCKVANVQDEELKKSAFITAIGKKAYKTLKDLLLPSKPEEKSFKDLVKVLSEHYGPTSQVIAERFKFNRRYQGEGESVAVFAVALKHMAAKCEFGQFLDDALRDRFVAGLRNPAIQTGLLKKKELTFETACEFAKSVELAERESRGFRPVAGTDAEVHAIKKTSRKPVSGSETRTAKNKCYRCGEEHDANSCRYRKTRCYHCKRTGHLSRVCRSRQTTADAVHNVDDEQPDSELLLYSVYHVGTTKRPYEVEVRLEGMTVKMQVDTGAAVSLLSESLFKLLKQPPSLAQCALKLKTYGGTPLEVIGQGQVAVEYNGQRKVLQIIVVPGDKPALLGRDWIESLGVDLNSIHEVHTELAPDSLVRRTNAVQHTRTPPYHPASNGAAERLVQTVKRSLLRQFRDEESTGVTRTIRHRLDQFLFVYRNTPCPTTGKTPAELFLSWKPRTRLSILHPELAKRTERGITQGQSRPNGTSWREFEAGDSVRVRGTRPGDPRWLEGTVVRRVSLSTYIVRVQSQERVIHVDDITSHAFAIPAPRTIRIPEETSTQQPPDPALAVQPQVEDETGTPLATPVSTEDEVATENNAPVPQLRRSSRTRKQPERYGFETK